MTTEEMTLITGLQSWTELADKIINNGWDRETVITITVDARINYIRDEGPSTIIFDQRKINLSTDMIKSRAYDEIPKKKAKTITVCPPATRNAPGVDD